MIGTGTRMKFVAFVLTAVCLPLFSGTVHGQGFRGSTQGMGSARAWSSSRAAPRQSFQRTQNHPQASIHQPGVAVQQTWTQPKPVTKNSVGDRQVTDRVAGSIRGKNRHHPHRPRHFHGDRGLVIIDVPHFAGTTTVITEVAPGVVRAERRYVEGSTEDVPGRGRDRLAPFDPTPQQVVERMLSLAAIDKDDVIYDLGSGDGRILITAAKKYGIRAVGFEIDPGLVKLARENARREGVEQLVEIRQQDFRTADLSPASVVTLYLSYEGNLAVRRQLKTHLKPGARIVSYTFDMGDWTPKMTESYRDAAGDTHLIYLWKITASTLASSGAEPLLQPHPTRDGPLIIELP